MIDLPRFLRRTCFWAAKARYVWLHAKSEQTRLRHSLFQPFSMTGQLLDQEMEGLGRMYTLWKLEVFYCCAGRRSAIPSLNNNQLSVDLTTRNKEFLTALELLLILASLLAGSPFLFVLIWVGLGSFGHRTSVRVKRNSYFGFGPSWLYYSTNNSKPYKSIEL